MPAPIHSDLADEIGVSPEKAEKLLRAMLREIHKRAGREGVRLPDLGKFTQKNGELVFEPSESLSRAVNHRFEGLDSEDLGSAPEPEEEEEEDNQGPSTITLGYQDSSNWSPIDDSETEARSPEEDEPDTAEFEVPSAEEAADTQELKASPPQAASQPSSSTDSAHSSDSTSEDDDLYPLVEDAPDDEPEPMTASHNSDDANGENDEHDSLSGIWESEEEDSDAPYSSEPETEPSFSSFQQSDEEEDDFSEISSQGEPSFKERFEKHAENRKRSESAPRPAQPTTRESTEQGGSRGARVFVTLLVVLLVGGGTWYVLGQQGVVPRPGPTFTDVQAQLRPHLNNLPFVGSDGTADSAPGSAADGTEASENDGAATEAPATAATSQSAETQSTEPSTSSSAASRVINPSRGGWTIVVASRTEFDAAQTLRDKFRQQFSNQQLPVDMVEGNVNNTTRYRVGVGQFDSRQNAQQFIENAGSELPNGAWLLQLQ